MKLPHVPNRIERMWMEYRWILKWNRLGGIELYIDPAPWAMDQYARIRREAERDIRCRYRDIIKKNRIGFWNAAKRIWNAYKGWSQSHKEQTR